MSGSRAERRAFAKVNLALAVGAPIAAPSAFAGYHPIASWMASVDLFDDLVVERLADGVPSRHEVRWSSDAPRSSPIDWPLEKDLAVRAHRLLESEAGRPLPARLLVTKRIPVGGGLGGGSADGAAALLALREVFGLGIGDERLRELSMKLGSDVGFFLDAPAPARPAIVSHLGERIERVAPVSQDVALFFPPFGCATGAVYRAFDAGHAGAGFEERADRVRALVIESVRRGSVATDDLFNDLASPACHVEPRLREIIDRLSGELNARVHVTGSGSTLFALAPTPGAASAMAARAAESVAGLAAVATRTA